MAKLNLVGPAVPDDFVDDGCTMSPDGWWREACRIHDFEYHRIRELVAERRAVRRQIGALKRIKADSAAVNNALMQLRQLKSDIRHARRTADINLQENIRRCSESGGFVMKASGWLLSRRYYGAVHRWGRKAVQGPGHAGNQK